MLWLLCCQFLFSFKYLFIRFSVLTKILSKFFADFPRSHVSCSATALFIFHADVCLFLKWSFLTGNIFVSMFKKKKRKKESLSGSFFFSPSIMYLLSLFLLGQFCQFHSAFEILRRFLSFCLGGEPSIGSKIGGHSERCSRS